jgi:cell division protein FtsA
MYVTAVGVVKDASNSMDGKYENPLNKYEEKKSEDYKNLLRHGAETENKEYESSGFVSKIKEFFTDFF